MRLDPESIFKSSKSTNWISSPLTCPICATILLLNCARTSWEKSVCEIVCNAICCLLTETKNRVPPISRNWSNTIWRYWSGNFLKNCTVWPMREPMVCETLIKRLCSVAFNWETHNQVPNTCAIKIPKNSTMVTRAMIELGIIWFQRRIKMFTQAPTHNPYHARFECYLRPPDWAYCVTG